MELRVDTASADRDGVRDDGLGSDQEDLPLASPVKKQPFEEWLKQQQSRGPSRATTPEPALPAAAGGGSAAGDAAPQADQQQQRGSEVGRRGARPARHRGAPTPATLTLRAPPCPPQAVGELLFSLAEVLQPAEGADGACSISWQCSKGAVTSLTISAPGKRLALDALAPACTSLQHLDVEAGAISGADEFIGGLVDGSLLSLRLVEGAEGRAEGALDPGLECLEPHTALQALELPRQQVLLPDGCEMLASLPQLRKVAIGGVVQDGGEGAGMDE
jgi:hypothetical protein